MNKKWWIIGGLIVVGAGVGAYFLFRKPKEDKEGNKREESESNDNVNQNVNQNVISKPSVNASQTSTGFPIKKGSRGDKVKELQKHLLCLGRDLGRAGADGIWGELTEQAMLKQPPKMNVLTNTNDYNTALGRMSAVIYRTADGRKCIEKA
jgi:peptidoglycan hydrolase-like protein with peptidoglycan-binding domain